MTLYEPSSSGAAAAGRGRRGPGGRRRTGHPYAAATYAATDGPGAPARRRRRPVGERPDERPAVVPLPAPFRPAFAGRALMHVPADPDHGVHPDPTPAPAPIPAHPDRGAWMPGIEALRGMAAGAVLVFHLWALTTLSPRIPGYRFMVGLGMWAVDLFFVLSGFLLVQSFWGDRRPGALRQYYVKRFFRIAPAYYLCLAVLMLGFADRHLLFSHKGLVQVAANTTFTQWLSPTTASSLNVSGVFWTLSIEMFLYALLPLFAWMIARRPVVSGVALFALGSAYRLYISFSPSWLAVRAFRAAPGVPQQIMELFLLRQFAGILPLFVIGMLLRWWLHYRPGARPGVAGGVNTAVLLALLVPSVAVLSLSLQALDVHNPLLFAAFDVVLVALLAPALAYAGRAVAGRLGPAMQALVWLGKRSYGVYLWHFPVILVVFGRGPMLRPAALDHLWLKSALAIAVSLVLGAVSYRLVEKPGRRLGARIAASVGRDRAPVLEPVPSGVAVATTG
ncbi:MAG TPA: acyltransferase [Acidimicrobiales bacterium]|nr:acyltransferase [Acidimicrobiales bacterium]